MKALDLIGIHKIQYAFWVIKCVKDLPRFFLHVGYFPIIFLIAISYVSQPYCRMQMPLTIWGEKIVKSSIFSDLLYFSGEQFNFRKCFHAYMVVGEPHI